VGQIRHNRRDELNLHLSFQQYNRPEMAEWLFSWTGAGFVALLTALASLAVHWYLCYWLYKRKILIKI